MSRRVVIIILTVLIIGIVGGTAAIISSRLRSQQANDTSSSGSGGLSEAPTGNQNITDPTGDDDGDGLSNSDEILWGTSRTNPDTDGDGFKDGEEVAAGHNPTIPSPNDTLPPGFQPGREVNPINVSGDQPVAVDQFFVEGLNLNPLGNRNLSEEYQQQYSESERSSATLKDFIAEQPIVTSLPKPRDEAVNIVNNSSTTALRTYLDTAGSLKAFSDNDALLFALQDLRDSGDTSSILGIAQGLRLHQENLLELDVPPQAENLQKLLLGYTELLRVTFEQIATWNEDPARAGVAIRQLQAADSQYFQLIQLERDRLEILSFQ